MTTICSLIEPNADSWSFLEKGNQYLTQPLTVNHSQLERVYSYKYLGVWLTSTLNWSTQITEISKKARSQLGIIYRNFYQHSNSATLLQLYLSYIRPHLEYAATVWDPHQVGFIHSLERIQKCALRMCTRKWKPWVQYTAWILWYPIPCSQKATSETLFLVPTDKWSHNFPWCTTHPKTTA